MSSGKPKKIKSTEAESLLNSLSKIQKSELQNLRKKSLEIHNEWKRLLDLQKVQMKALEDGQKRQQDFMKIILEEQRQMDAAQLQKDGQFLLQLGNVFAQK